MGNDNSVLVRFGLRGIPIFPNAATFKRRMSNAQMLELRKRVQGLQDALRPIAPDIASRLFIEVVIE